MSGNSITDPSKQDDQEALALLTSPSSSSLLLPHGGEINFFIIANRIASDTTSSSSSSSSSSSWEEWMKLAANDGFTCDVHRDAEENRSNILASNTTEMNSIRLRETSNFPAPYDTAAAKRHLDAAVVLLGIDAEHARQLTDAVLNEYSNGNGDTGGGNQEKDGSDAGKDADNDTKEKYKAKEDHHLQLLGTKRLLLLVRDKHYAQQKARIQIVAETMRLECGQDDVNMEDGTSSGDNTGQVQVELRQRCVDFLNNMDEGYTYASSSRNNKNEIQQRGLFRLLISLACVPSQPLGREELYRAWELSDTITDDSARTGNGYGSMAASTRMNMVQTQDFAKQLMEEHYTHYNATMRTEALEALFMLLYQRIDGGIDRCDYVLLLHAFASRGFFADEDGQGQGQRQAQAYSGLGLGIGGSEISTTVDAKRRSQLTGMILAECMALWRTAGSAESSDSNSGEDWVTSHPFLGNVERAEGDIQMIGRKLLQQTFAPQVLQRRQIQYSILQAQSASAAAASGMAMAIKNTADAVKPEEDVEAPEAIALLTFGLILKLSHSHSQAQSSSTPASRWAANMSIKELAVECVSMANDDCGAFGYLGQVMTFLLPSSSPLGDSSSVSSKNHESFYDLEESMLEEWFAAGGDGHIPAITNGTNEDKSSGQTTESSTLIYASIGREIIVSTLSAFRSSLERSLVPSKVDNLGMFCQLAAKIHRRSNILCQRFWDDWNSTPQNVNLSEASSVAIVGGVVDPFVYLFDTAHTVATAAFERLHVATSTNTNSGLGGVSTDIGRRESSILPCLSPLLTMLSSLLDEREDATTTLRTCIPDGMIHAALLGCLYLCSKENATLHHQNSENKRLLDAANNIMDSLCVIASIAGKSGSKECVAWLRDAVGAENSMTVTSLRGPALLHRIAVSAHKNMLLDLHAPVIASNALLVMAYSCRGPTSSDNHAWLCRVEDCFSSLEDEGFRSFASQFNAVTDAFTLLWLEMVSCLGNLVLTGSVSSNAIIKFMKTSEKSAMVACDIISATSHTLDLPMSHENILGNSIRTVQEMLLSVNSIASCCKSADAVDAAKTIRYKLLQCLAESTSLGSKIGFFATIPIAKEIERISSIENKKMHMLSKSESSQMSFVEEKKEALHVDTSLDNLSPQSKKSIVDIGENSLSLIQTWGKVNECMAMENANIAHDGDSLSKSLSGLSAEQRSAVGSDLVSFGPCRLMLSTTLRPLTAGGAQSTNWPDENVPLLSLITKYIDWSGCSERYERIAIKAVDILRLTVLNCKFNISGEEMDLDSALEMSVSQVGSQLRSVLCGIFKKSVSTMKGHKLLLFGKILSFLELCIVHHPTLASKILEEDSSGSTSLIDQMLDALVMETPNSISTAIVSLRCLQVLTQLWLSCSENYRSTSSTGTRTLYQLHPCDNIAHSFIMSKRLVKNCILSVETFQPALAQIFSAQLLTEMKSSAIFHRGVVLDYMVTAFKIIEADACTRLRSTECDSSNDNMSIAFLKKISQGQLLKQFLEIIGYHDGITVITKASEDFKQLASSENLALSLSAFSEPTATITLINKLPFTESRESLQRSLLCSDATSYLLTSQSMLNSGISRLGEIVLTSVGGACSSSELLTIATEAVQNYFDLSENIFIMKSAAPYTLTSTQLQQSIVCGNSLMSLVITCFSALSSTPTEFSKMNNLLEKILRASKRLVDLIDPDDRSLPGSLLLRLNTVTCAIIILGYIGERTDPTLSYDDEHLFKSIRIGVCRFACDCLSKLKHSTVSENHKGSDIMPYGYNTDIETTRQMNLLPLSLLHSSISLLTVIALTTEESSSQGISLSSRSFQSELTDTIRSRGTIEVLSYHLQHASSVTAEIYQRMKSNLASESSFETVDKTLAFFSVLCASKSTEIVELVLESNIISSSLTNHHLLTTAVEKWSTSPKSVIVRGYLQTSNHSQHGSLRPMRHTHDFVKDPAHDIWCSTIKIVASLLNSSNSSISGGASSKHAALLAIDFLHFYEKPITIFIQNCLTQEAREKTSLPSAIRSSGFEFTVATMNELADILALVSELCYGNHRKQFQIASKRLYQIMSEAAIAVVRSLSSFVGALGISREVFAALSSLDDVMSESATSEAASIQHQNLANRPLFSQGILSAKHEAIKNALYASSCCKAVTPHEKSLSPDESKSAQGADNNQLFHRHVSNDFVLLMESIAGQCIFNALTVIQMIHPRSSSFVTFTANEAAHLNLTSGPPIGAIVAIRSGSEISAHLTGSCANIRYGRVIYFNPIAKVLDIEYFDSDGIAAERHVSVTRLAALEDVSKRSTLFTYKAAPESVADSASMFSGEASIGNLILLLRWCRQHMSSLEAASSNDNGIGEDVVKSIAEITFIILGDEVGLHMELESPKFDTQHETQFINRQLLELFDDLETLSNFDLGASSDSQKSPAIFQQRINVDIWTTVQSQLELSLVTGRADREVIRKNSEQAGTTFGSFNWGRKTTPRGSRKSPFS